MIDNYKIIDGGIWIPLEEIEELEKEQLQYLDEATTAFTTGIYHGQFNVFNEMHRLIEQDNNK